MQVHVYGAQCSSVVWNNLPVSENGPGKIGNFGSCIGEIGTGLGKIRNIREIEYWIRKIGEIRTGIQNGSKQSGLRWIGNIGKRTRISGTADKSGLLDKYMPENRHFLLILQPNFVFVFQS